jgi:hypothetical protein
MLPQNGFHPVAKDAFSFAVDDSQLQDTIFQARVDVVIEEGRQVPRRECMQVQDAVYRDRDRLRFPNFGLAVIFERVMEILIHGRSIR